MSRHPPKPARQKRLRRRWRRLTTAYRTSCGGRHEWRPAVKALSDFDLIALVKCGYNSQAIDQLWRRHGQFIQLSMLKYAHHTGDTSTRWHEAGAIFRYETVGGTPQQDEGVDWRPELSTDLVREGALEQEIRSAAY